MMKIGFLVAGPNPAIDDENPGEAGLPVQQLSAKFDSLDEAKQCGQAKILMWKPAYMERWSSNLLNAFSKS